MKLKENTKESAKFGAPTLYGEKMKQTAIYMPRHMIDWLKSQDGTMSEVIRSLIEREWAAYQKKASK